MESHRPRLVDKLLRLFAQKPALLREIPVGAGVLALVVAVLPPLAPVRIVAGVFAILCVLLWVVSAVSTYFLPDALRTLYARRFLRLVHDDHLAVILSARSPAKVDNYLAAKHPAWHTRQLAADLRERSRDLGVPIHPRALDMNATEEPFDARAVLTSYGALREAPNDLDAILTILRRHNMAWMLEQIDGPDFPVPHQYEPVPSEDAFTEYLPKLYQRPFFYRLAFLRQLSTVALTRHLDATHTRLSHAIGVVKVATKMLERILPDWPNLNEARQKVVSCLFYCFIHDSFHGPMGHSLDMMKDVFDPSMSSKLDDEYLRGCLERIVASPEGGKPEDLFDRRVLEAAEACAPDGWSGKDVIAHVLTLSRADDLADSDPEFFFMRDIVDSDLDADRLDYLMRDARVLGEAADRIPSLIDRVRAVEQDGMLRLAYPKDMEDVVTATLGLRRNLYTNFYEHSEKLVVDDMICHGLYYVLSDKGLLIQTHDEATLRKRREILRHIMLLTDDDFFPALAELRARPESYELLLRVRRHDYYVPVFESSIQRDRLEVIQQGIADWSRAVGDWYRTVDERGGIGRDDIPALQEVSAPYTEKVELLIPYLQWKLRGSFLERRKLEVRLWAELVAADRDGSMREKFIATQYGHVDYMPVELLDTYPPVHITTTSYFKGATEAAFEGHPKEGSGAGVILFYETDAGGVTRSAGWTTIRTAVRATQRIYPVILSVPPALCDAFTQEGLRGAFLRELRSCRWLYEALREGRSLPRSLPDEPVVGG